MNTSKKHKREKDYKKSIQKSGLDPKAFERKKEIIKEGRELNWFSFCISYLDLASAGCNTFLDRKAMPGPFFKLIAISVVYNIKHALEIVIKFLHRVCIKESCDFDHDAHHNISKLFTAFNKTILRRISETEKEEMKNDLKELEVIVYKYYRLELFKKLILRDLRSGGYFNLEDIENTFLKYPESKVIKLEIPFHRIVDKIKTEDIKGIKDDIRKICQVVNNINRYMK